LRIINTNFGVAFVGGNEKKKVRKTKKRFRKTQKRQKKNITRRTKMGGKRDIPSGSFQFPLKGKVPKTNNSNQITVSNPLANKNAINIVLKSDLRERDAVALHKGDVAGPETSSLALPVSKTSTNVIIDTFSKTLSELDGMIQANSKIMSQSKNNESYDYILAETKLYQIQYVLKFMENILYSFFPNLQVNIVESPIEGGAKSLDECRVFTKEIEKNFLYFITYSNQQTKDYKELRNIMQPTLHKQNSTDTHKSAFKEKIDLWLKSWNNAEYISEQIKFENCGFLKLNKEETKGLLFDTIEISLDKFDNALDIIENTILPDIANRQKKLRTKIWGLYTADNLEENIFESNPSMPIDAILTSITIRDEYNTFLENLVGTEDFIKRIENNQNEYNNSDEYHDIKTQIIDKYNNINASIDEANDFNRNFFIPRRQYNELMKINELSHFFKKMDEYNI
jgi:hypothetical protein